MNTGSKLKTMTKFEIYLISKGYLKYRLNPKSMKYEISKVHLISTMRDIDYRYIHKDDKVLEKINQGKSVMDDDFTFEDRKNIICFGLCEKGKPPTLKSPRPKIRVKRFYDFNGEKRIEIETERRDNSMNMVLMNEDPEEILKSLFNKNIIFKYDTTKK